MRSDRLTRKTYLKKNHTGPEGEIAVYDLTAPHGETAGTVSMNDIVKGDGENCGFETVQDILSWCTALVAESPAAAKMWTDAAEKGWNVGIADLRGGGFHLDIPAKRLILDHFSLSPAALGRSAYFRNTLLITLIRALRDIWHESRQAPFEAEYGPEDVLMLERVRAADGDTVTVLAVWELRGAGHAGIWRHMIGSAEGDMALTFARFLERDPSSMWNGAALAYAFRQWYTDESRVDCCDHETLESLDGLMAGTAELRPFGARPLDAAALESLAILPDGTCYLAGLGDTVRRDPFFAGLRDEINQTHLFQIMYDMEVTMVNNIPFRDKTLARKFFPQGEMSSF